MLRKLGNVFCQSAFCHWFNTPRKICARENFNVDFCCQSVWPMVSLACLLLVPWQGRSIMVGCSGPATWKQRKRKGPNSPFEDTPLLTKCPHLSLLKVLPAPDRGIHHSLETNPLTHWVLVGMFKMQVTAILESVCGSLVFPELFELTKLSSFYLLYFIACI